MFFIILLLIGMFFTVIVSGIVMFYAWAIVPLMNIKKKEYEGNKPLLLISITIGIVAVMGMYGAMKNMLP